jgi:hypothetical protein
MPIMVFEIRVSPLTGASALRRRLSRPGGTLPAHTKHGSRPTLFPGRVQGADYGGPQGVERTVTFKIDDPAMIAEGVREAMED